MPPKKQPPKKQPPTTVERGDSGITTRASNANKHPGTEAQKVLQNRRSPEEIQADKDMKKAKKEARQAEADQRESAQKHLEARRALQAARLEDEDKSFPQKQPEAKSKYSIFSK